MWGKKISEDDWLIIGHPSSVCIFPLFVKQRTRWLDGITDLWTWVWVSSRSWWWTGGSGVAVHGVTKSRTWLSNWTELNWRNIYSILPLEFNSPVREESFLDRQHQKQLKHNLQRYLKSTNKKGNVLKTFFFEKEVLWGNHSTNHLS